MLDLNFIRENPKIFDAALAKRGAEKASDTIIALDEKRRAVQTNLQESQARRNSASKEIGALKSRGEDASEAMKTVVNLKGELQELEDFERQLGTELKDLLMRLPNMPLDSVPVGAGEAENILIEKVGKPKVFSFTPVEHFDLGEALGMMDFERAAKLSGARFVVLRGALARLERALGQFMLDLHVDEHGYVEHQTPVLVRDAALYGTGQLPKFATDQFRTEDGFWLIPTAEVTLTNIYGGEILPMSRLPMRLTALTQCFRSEAGSAGRDTRGMIRQHQFNKVELVSIVKPEDGLNELERMTNAAETVLKRLELPYQKLELCTGDMGFGARKTYDLEVWLPGQDRYREISSCSLCGDFQSRRMNMRTRGEGEKQSIFPYTLNGSGLAVGRTLVALMENYQEEGGAIRVPEVLRPYMGGVEIITP
jgi:seryl-tRNA synthetase